MHDTNMAEGVPVHEVSFAACKRHCIREPTCIGINIDATPNSHTFCLLTKKDTILSSQKGSTHLNLTRTCKGLWPTVCSNEGISDVCNIS